MGRYYGLEALRNPKLQKKAINYALSKAQPFIQKTGVDMLDQLSTKIRPKKKYIHTYTLFKHGKNISYKLRMISSLH